ncbi:RNA-binding transcriptional accessory protein [Pseudohalioglobus sediminis]|uniref:RNA-binding transcriptional accessory protein n=1 Tax=Pseudohalioglobus sediminis TaxID=2606449 RepID=A0A5B0WR70_9GAMM|nr:Tex family protein [Pseudohalioglobus sediminis]KAA1189017.1 RNA-binding transcriptional accessory protein [Pseudohalioglobus sediminis]
MNKTISQRIAEELAVREAQVNAAIDLLDEGATVPFIARYRKEATGALDDTQMRHLEERLHYLRDLDERRDAILKSIDEQGKLTAELSRAIAAADTKNRLEDLYLPFKPRRRTKAQIAREAGLEPLADKLLQDPMLDPESEAAGFLNAEAGFTDIKSTLDGARQILMERFAEDADLLEKLRQFLLEHGQLSSAVVAGKEQEGAKFSDYFEHIEPLSKVPSHRALAMFRGRNEGVLNLHLLMHAEEKPTDAHPCEGMVAEHWAIRDEARPADTWLREVVRWTWRVKLLTHLQTDLLGQLRERAEREAIEVFAANLKDLLLAAPAGQKATIGLDPGLRTGVKMAVIDANGKVLDHGSIFPHAPQKRTHEAESTLRQMIEKYDVDLIAIGNGTAGRETDRFVGDLLKAHPQLGCRKVMVNEAGASIYSASEFAAREFPELDVTIRGAISIARRLQDPLAELVKIEPKSIGVGQYQHDVSQVQLARQLDAVVEDCVNAVGVDVNTASVPLLARVSGLNQSLASNIVQLRDQEGSFTSRRALLKVPRFGDKTFEQAAGFLRIHGGEDPLDASAVHPESYQVVARIAAHKGKDIASIIGDSGFLCGLQPADYTSDSVGLPTVRDIIAELDKPGRDPRPEFKMAEFQEGVEKLSDLRPDMVLEGTVTNVTNFGAFVDIGVHQDGLVHISALADKFVKDPREVVKAGDIVRVKVMEVDEARKRIGLSMRLADKAGEAGSGRSAKESKRQRGHSRAKPRPEKAATNTALADAFARAGRK